MEILCLRSLTDRVLGFEPSGRGSIPLGGAELNEKSGVNPINFCLRS